VLQSVAVVVSALKNPAPVYLQCFQVCCSVLQCVVVCCSGGIINREPSDH